MEDAGPTCGKIEDFGEELHAWHILLRIERSAREIGCVLAAVHQVPEVVFSVVMPHVSEEHGGTRDVLEDFHGEGCIAVSFGGADNGFVRTIPVVRVVQKG